jgi:UDP-glucose 4-epimerase
MTDTQRILVTGASGFVGSNIVQVLLDEGQRVIATDRAFDPALVLQWQGQSSARGIELIECDAVHLPSLKVDTLIHAAAITASPQAYGQTPEQNFRANIEPMLAVLEWAQRNQVRRSLFISSSAIYINNAPGPYDETTLAASDGLYAVAKQTMEALVATLRHTYNRDLVVMRLSNIYGPNEQPRRTRPRVSVVAAMIQEAIETGRLRLSNEATARDWTFAPDIGQAALALLSADQLNHSLYNVASQQMFTPLEIAQTIQTLLPHVEIEFRQPTLAETSLRGYLVNERLRREVGFSAWTPFAEGLKQTIAAHKLLVERAQ